MVKECDMMTQKDGSFSGAAGKFIAYNLCMEIKLRLNSLPKPNELKEVFELVIETHDEMKKLAEGGDFDTMVERVSHFQQRIEYLKTKFDILINS